MVNTRGVVSSMSLGQRKQLIEEGQPAHPAQPAHPSPGQEDKQAQRARDDRYYALAQAGLHAARREGPITTELTTCPDSLQTEINGMASSRSLGTIRLLQT